MLQRSILVIAVSLVFSLTGIAQGKIAGGNTTFDEKGNFTIEGNLGLGILNPTTRLDMNGILTIRKDDNPGINFIAGNRTAMIGLQDDGDQGFFVRTADQYRFNVDMNGNVGIGNQTLSDHRLYVTGNATGGLVRFRPRGFTPGSTNNHILILQSPRGYTGSMLLVRDHEDRMLARINSEGEGTFRDLRLQSDNNHSYRLRVDQNGDLNFVGDQDRVAMQITDQNGNIKIKDNAGNNTILIKGSDNDNQVGSEIKLYGGAGLNNTIELDGNWNGTGKGRIRTDELEIIGGSDISEKFEVTAAETTSVQAGMLVAIGDGDLGVLDVTQKAYDKRVVGIVSGANGVNTGLYMGQKGSEADGKHPIALVGRVYVWADASYGKIERGDMLTSSPVPGYAMKVKNRKKAKGAIVGKAMSTLESGQGYVLVLVNLQ